MRREKIDTTYYGLLGKNFKKELGNLESAFEAFRDSSTKSQRKRYPRPWKRSGR